MELTASDGTVIDASQVRWVNNGTIWATFDLTSQSTGSYSLKLTDPSRTATLPSAFQVDSGPAGQLNCLPRPLPPHTGPGQSGIATVTYTNIGDTDIAAPILDLRSTQALLVFRQQLLPAVTASTSWLPIPTAPGGILQPGAKGSVSFTYKPLSPGDISISVGTLTAGSTIDWTSLEPSSRLPTVDQTGLEQCLDGNSSTASARRLGQPGDSAVPGRDGAEPGRPADQRHRHVAAIRTVPGQRCSCGRLP